MTATSQSGAWKFSLSATATRATTAAALAAALAAQPVAARDVSDPELAAKAELASLCAEVAYPDDSGRFLRRVDLTGDGKDDVVIRFDVACDGHEQMFCGRSSGKPGEPARCAGNVYVALSNGSYRRTSLPPEFDVADLDGSPAVRVVSHGAACGKIGGETCETFYRWNGEDFARVEDGGGTPSQPGRGPIAPNTPPGQGGSTDVTPPTAPKPDGVFSNPAPGREAATPTEPSEGEGGYSNPVPGQGATEPERPTQPPAGGYSNPVPGQDAAEPARPAEPPANGGDFSNPPPGQGAAGSAEPAAPPSDGGGFSNPVPGQRSAEPAAPPSSGGTTSNPVPGQKEPEAAKPASDEDGGFVNPPPSGVEGLIERGAPSQPAAAEGASQSNPAPGEAPRAEAPAAAPQAAAPEPEPDAAPEIDASVPRKPTSNRWWYEYLGNGAALVAILGQDGRSTMILSCERNDPTLLLTLAVSPDAARKGNLPRQAGALVAVAFSAGKSEDVRLMSYDAGLHAWTDRIAPQGDLARALRAGNKIVASEAGQSFQLFSATLRGSSKALEALAKSCDL